MRRSTIIRAATDRADATDILHRAARDWARSTGPTVDSVALSLVTALGRNPADAPPANLVHLGAMRCNVRRLARSVDRGDRTDADYRAAVGRIIRHTVDDVAESVGRRDVRLIAPR